MQRLDRIIEQVCQTAVIVCGILLIGSAGYVSADLINRTVFNASLVGANEISGYVLAISTAWAFSYALINRSHIRIDVFYRYLPARWRAGIDIAAVASLAGFAAVFVFFAQQYLFFVWAQGSRSITSLAMPLWIPMLAWLIGWIFFLLVSIYLTIVAVFALLRGEIGEVQRRVGAISEDEEAALELDPAAVAGQAEREAPERC
jgi:TRAP-type C4-dicarboxylate transport system permease small subunit